MGQFDYMLEPRQRAERKKSEAQAIGEFRKGMEASLRAAVQPLSDGYKEAQKSLKDDLKALEAAVSDDSAATDALNSVKQSIDALQGMEGRIIEALEGMEGVIKAEIGAIPVPERPEMPKEVDLQPVLDAIERIPAPEKVEMPKTVEPKTQWTFDIKRNRTTGLIESIDAR